MLTDTGPVLLVLGLSGAMLQISIFVTISKCGALTCSLFGTARKIATLVVSILFFGHVLNWVQTLGLVISIYSMVKNFIGGKKKKEAAHATRAPTEAETANDGPKASLEYVDQVRAEINKENPTLNIIISSVSRTSRGRRRSELDSWPFFFFRRSRGARRSRACWKQAATTTKTTRFQRPRPTPRESEESLQWRVSLRRQCGVQLSSTLR
jgi:hypothetical protein